MLRCHPLWPGSVVASSPATTHALPADFTLKPQLKGLPQTSTTSTSAPSLIAKAKPQLPLPRTPPRCHPPASHGLSLPQIASSAWNLPDTNLTFMAQLSSTSSEALSGSQDAFDCSPDPHAPEAPPELPPGPFPSQLQPSTHSAMAVGYLCLPDQR